MAPATRPLLRVWPWAAAVLSGVMLVLCFPPWNQSWLCWIALIPLICATLFSPTPARRAWLHRAGLGFAAGYTFFLGTFWWLSELAGLYKNGWLLTLPALLALVLGMYVAFWSWFIGRVLPRLFVAPAFSSSVQNLAFGLVGASAWIIHEWVRERLFGGFGWNPLSVALYRDLPMIQIAEFTGASGLSFLIVFVNLMAAIIVRRIIGELGPAFMKRIRWEFSVTMAILAGVFAFGLRQLLAQSKAPGSTLRVLAVQPNIPQTEKFDRDSEEKVLTDLERVTKLALLSAPTSQLLIWPESAEPTGMFSSERNFRLVMDLVEQGDFSMLLGTVSFDPQANEAYNSALLLTQRGQGRQFYHKIHLVPFGEYLPMRPVLGPIVGDLIPGDFNPGREYTVLQLSDPPVKLSTLICFEDTVGDLTRQFVVRGAEALVNITNDGWFGRTPAAEQHLANAALRAVENRRPLIRCGNTGVTCLVTPTGFIDRWISPFETGSVARGVNIAAHPPITFYSRHGDWLTKLAAAIVALASILAWRKGLERELDASPRERA